MHHFAMHMLLLSRIERLKARCAEPGWQLDFLTPGWLTRELMPLLRRLKVGFTVAHMGMFLAQAGFRELMDLLRHVAGRRWVKLKGVYLMSTAPGFADAATRHRILADNPQHLFRF